MPLVEQMGDGGFESSFGFGPNGNEVPGDSDTPGLTYPYLNWSDDSQDANLQSVGQILWQEDASSFNPPWTVSSANPRSGTYHIRCTSNSIAASMNTLYVGTEQAPQTHGDQWGAIGVPVTPGLAVEISLWIAAASMPTNSEVWLMGHIAALDPGDASADTGNWPDPDKSFVVWADDSAITSTYTQLTRSFTMPLADESSPYFFTQDVAYWYPAFRITNPNKQSGHVVDIDDVSVKVNETTLSLFVTPRGFRFPYQKWA